MSKNKSIWITGASSGIGLSLAKNLSTEGTKIFASSRRVDVLKKELNGIKGDITIIRCDVTSPLSVKKCYDEIISSARTLDVLINNAGTTSYRSFIETPEKEFDDIITTNLKGVYLCTKAVIKAMVKRRSGLIINVLSVAANTVFSNSSIYAASKAAVLAMSNVIRKEVRDKNVRICNLIPGAIDTPMWEEKIRNKHRKRMMKSESISKVVHYIIQMPGDVAVEDITLKPIKGDL